MHSIAIWLANNDGPMLLIRSQGKGWGTFMPSVGPSVGIDIQKLNVDCGNVTTPHEIDLLIAAGEVVALLGSPVCDKAPLLWSLSGFYQAHF